LTGDPEENNESEDAGEDQMRFEEYAIERVGSPCGDPLRRHVPRENVFELVHVSFEGTGAMKKRRWILTNRNK
jgi:hypothetical protein